MKKLVLCAAIAAFSTTAFADVEPQFYAGLSLSTGHGTEKLEVNSIEVAEYDYDVAGYSIYGGYVFKSNNRFEISSTRINARQEDNTGGTFDGIDFDWKFTLNDKDITPYLGVGFGFYTYKDSGDLFVNGEDLKGIAFTLAGGLLAKLGEHGQLDFSVSHKGIGWNAIRDEFNNEYDLYDGVTRFTLGAAYLF